METVILTSIVWFALFFYFYWYRPPRKIHNKVDLSKSLKNMADFLGYDVITVKSTNIKTNKISDLYIICDSSMTKDIVDSLQG